MCHVGMKISVSVIQSVISGGRSLLLVVVFIEHFMICPQLLTCKAHFTN